MTKVGNAAGVCVGRTAYGRAFTLVMMPTPLVIKGSGQNLRVWSVGVKRWWYQTKGGESDLLKTRGKSNRTSQPSVRALNFCCRVLCFLAVIYIIK